jgi:hypothetical protein
LLGAFSLLKMNSLIRRDWIESAIREHIAEAKGRDSELGASVVATIEAMGALPLWCDWGGGVAIRPDGELLGFLWDEPDSVKVETDPHLRFLACLVGAEDYAELAALLPVRTVQDRDCPLCKGRGVIAGFEELKNIRCYCGGAGWLPSDVPNPPSS